MKCDHCGCSEFIREDTDRDSVWCCVRCETTIITKGERDYWCIVALNYDKTEAIAIAASADVTADDLLCGGRNVLYEIDETWAKDNPPGLYRLSLKDSDDLLHPPHVAAIECLVVFPPLVSTRSADEFETINRRWRSARPNRRVPIRHQDERRAGIIAEE